MADEKKAEQQDSSNKPVTVGDRIEIKTGYEGGRRPDPSDMLPPPPPRNPAKKQGG